MNSTNDFQEMLLFPFKDKDSWNQFLIACALMLAMYVIPVLPMLLLMGYTARIMRQVIEERRSPSLPAWKGSDWSAMLTDGLRLYGAQIVLMLPLFILFGCGMVFLFGGSMGLSIISESNQDSLVPLLMIPGFLLFAITGILSIPYSIVVSAAIPHVAVKRSFQATFEFNIWFSIFRKAFGQFILGYAAMMVISLVLSLVMQIAVMTIVLICLVPIIMIPFVTYQLIVMNTIFAQAYAWGLEGMGTS